MLNGLPVTGIARSVKEHQSSNPKRWTVTVVPKERAVQASSVLLDTVISASELMRQFLFSCRAALRDFTRKGLLLFK
jgi:hypothetical protein